MIQLITILQMEMKTTSISNNRMELHAADAISVIQIHKMKTDSTHLIRDFGRKLAKVNRLGDLFCSVQPRKKNILFL